MTLLLLFTIVVSFVVKSSEIVINARLDVSDRRVSTVFLSSGLVGHWLFDGNISGGGNHGSTQGVSLTIDRHGNPNSAYLFDGSSYIQVIDDSSLDIIRGDITLSMFIKTGASQPSAYTGILNKHKYSTVAMWVLQMEGTQANQFHLAVSIGGVWYCDTGKGAYVTLTANTWQHLVAICEMEPP